MSDARFRVPGLMVMVLLLALLAPARVQAETPAKPWDKDELAKILNRFTIQTKHIQEGVGRNVEEAKRGSAQRIVLNDVYGIHHRAISLESAVRAGEGRDETEPLFRRLVNNVQNAREDAKTYPAIEKVRGPIGKARALLREMYGYYYAGPMPKSALPKN